MPPVITLPVDVVVQLKSSEDSAPSPPVKPRQISFEDEIHTANIHYNDGSIAEDIQESNNESASSNGNSMRDKENRVPLRSRTEMKKFPTQ